MPIYPPVLLTHQTYKQILGAAPKQRRGAAHWHKPSHRRHKEEATNSVAIYVAMCRVAAGLKRMICKPTSLKPSVRAPLQDLSGHRVATSTRCGARSNLPPLQPRTLADPELTTTRYERSKNPLASRKWNSCRPRSATLGANCLCRFRRPRVKRLWPRHGVDNNRD